MSTILFEYLFIISVEFCGPACAAYQQIFTPALLQYVTDKSAEVRQAAAYGCGVLGQVKCSTDFSNE